MIKRSIALAVLATLASGAALAQSSVTLYGRLNVTAERQKVGSDTQTVLEDNYSRIGFKGEEDLGGGLKAGFIIEHGFDPTTGAAASTFWGRQSEVYLSSKLGMLRLGNFIQESLYATADVVSMHNHNTGTSADALYTYFGSNVNKVAYRTPEFVKGLWAEASIAEATAGTGGKRPVDLAVNYDLGKLQLGAGYTKADQDNQFAVRASYGMGPFTLAAYAQRDEINDASRNVFRVAGMYTLGASEFHVNVGYAGKRGDLADTQATQATLGYNYNLSKRTKVYGFVTKVDNKAAAEYMTKKAGVDFSSVAVGVRHNF
jgi:predicted porin